MKHIPPSKSRHVWRLVRRVTWEMGRGRSGYPGMVSGLDAAGRTNRLLLRRSRRLPGRRNPRPRRQDLGQPSPTIAPPNRAAGPTSWSAPKSRFRTTSWKWDTVEPDRAWRRVPEPRRGTCFVMCSREGRARGATVNSASMMLMLDRATSIVDAVSAKSFQRMHGGRTRDRTLDLSRVKGTLSR